MLPYRASGTALLNMRSNLTWTRSFLNTKLFTGGSAAIAGREREEDR